MSGKKFNIPAKTPRVLVAPLEWGLGHATRCVPIINELLVQGCDVLIAAETAAAALLAKEFPQLRILPLQGYRMQYSRKKNGLPLKLLLQFPKLLYRIYKEQQWLKKIVVTEAIDAVISDNRLGLYHTKLPAIYITHQLAIETGSTFTNLLAQRIHYLFINKYRTCWVPDEKTAINLAGKLSHPLKMPRIPVQYIGPLSRFEEKALENKYDLLICLSGPEPQRTIFENIIVKGLGRFSGKVLLVRGLPDTGTSINNNNPLLACYNHLSSGDLNEAILQSNMVLSRSGYTTVMDLVKLRKKAILVPTPGQKEQEYLAERLMDRNIFYCCSQKDFSLHEAIQKAAAFPFHSIEIDQSSYKKAIVDFVATLKGQ